MATILEGVARLPANASQNGALLPGGHASCRFYVGIGNGQGGKEIKALFTELSGLQVEMVLTDYEEGGTNNFVHRLPGRLKVGNITLKHGLTKSNEFLSWVLAAALVKPMDRRNVTVFMYDSGTTPVVKWNFIKAFPVKWTGPTFTADATTMAIESVELAHEGLTVDTH